MTTFFRLLPALSAALFTSPAPAADSPPLPVRPRIDLGSLQAPTRQAPANARQIGCEPSGAAPRVGMNVPLSDQTGCPQPRLLPGRDLPHPTEFRLPERR